jgi:hypothetical protein
MLAAADDYSLEKVRVLLSAGVDVDETDCDGMTALHYAARHNPNPKCLALLLDAGVDPDETDDDGLTALEHAVRHNALICDSPEYQALLRATDDGDELVAGLASASAGSTQGDQRPEVPPHSPQQAITTASPSSQTPSDPAASASLPGSVNNAGRVPSIWSVHNYGVDVLPHVEQEGWKGECIKNGAKIGRFWLEMGSGSHPLGLGIVAGIGSLILSLLVAAWLVNAVAGPEATLTAKVEEYWDEEDGFSIREEMSLRALIEDLQLDEATVRSAFDSAGVPIEGSLRSLMRGRRGSARANRDAEGQVTTVAWMSTTAIVLGVLLWTLLFLVPYIVAVGFVASCPSCKKWMGRKIAKEERVVEDRQSELVHGRITKKGRLDKRFNSVICVTESGFRRFDFHCATCAHTWSLEQAFKTSKNVDA